MKHYTKAELDMYRHGDMNLPGRIQCTAHLKECPECNEKLEELKVDDVAYPEYGKYLSPQ